MCWVLSRGFHNSTCLLSLSKSRTAATKPVSPFQGFPSFEQRLPKLYTIFDYPYRVSNKWYGTFTSVRNLPEERTEATEPLATLSRPAQSETKLLLKQTSDTILLTMPGRHYPSLLQSFGSWLSPCRQHAGIRGWQPSYSISELMTYTDKTSSETRCQQVPIFYDLDNW